MQHTFYKLHSSAVAESNELNITLENNGQQQHLQQQQQHLAEASPPLPNHYEYLVDGGGGMAAAAAFPPYPATIQVRLSHHLFLKNALTKF